MSERPSFDKDTIRKLLGGYATGTLTADEREALFAAALEDQELFDALAHEQSLRDLLSDPAARAQLLASIDDVPLPWYKRFWKPIGVVAAAAVLTAVGVYIMRPKPAALGPVLSARIDHIAPVPAPGNAPPPAPPPVVDDRPAAAAAAPKAKVTAKATEIKHEDALADKESGPVVSTPAVAGPAAGVPMAAPAAAAPPPPPPLQKAAEPAVAMERRDGKADAAANASLQSVAGFLDAGSKQIPLQNAQALFFDKLQTDQQQSGKPMFAARGKVAGTGGAQTKEQAEAQSQSQDKDAQVQMQSLGALQGFTANAVRAAYLGMNWVVLRQRDGGEFVKVDPRELRAGDIVKLRLTPNDDGYVTIWENGAPWVAAMRVTKFTPFDTPVLTGAASGTRLLAVQFARTAPPQTGIVRTAAEQQSANDARDHSTYVLNASASPAAPVSTTITLVFR